MKANKITKVIILMMVMITSTSLSAFASNNSYYFKSVAKAVGPGKVYNAPNGGTYDDNLYTSTSERTEKHVGVAPTTFWLYLYAKADDGASFEGWYDNEACTGTALSTETFFMPEHTDASTDQANPTTVTYYAKFVSNSPTGPTAVDYFDYCPPTYIQAQNYYQSVSYTHNIKAIDKTKMTVNGTAITDASYIEGSLIVNLHAEGAQTPLLNGTYSVVLQQGAVTFDDDNINTEFTVDWIAFGSPILVIDANSNNTSAIFDGLMNTKDITISNLTLKAGKWSTICLPFAVGPAQIEAVFGAGTEIAKLASSTYDAAENELTLTFTSETEMAAGAPYLIKVPADVANPYFTDVTIYADEGNPVTTDYATMQGAFNPTVLTGGDMNTWFISNNTFYYPSVNGTLAATKCWFTLLGDAQQSPAQSRRMSVRMRTGNDDAADGIINVSAPAADDAIYNLNGVRVGNATNKGIYIRNGVKMIVK